MHLKGVQCVFHYIPLHNSEFGKNISRTSGDLAVTEDIAAQLVRLPIWLGIDAAKVSQSVKDTLK